MPKEENLYQLLNDRCNTEQIRDLLRKFKDLNEVTKKDIRIGGNKEDVLRNLKRAVTKKHIPPNEPIGLLRDCEENGHQHIFYFKPRTAAVRKRCQDYDEILESLIGQEWSEEYPLFEFIPDDYQWVDFRNALPGKPQDWLFKAYGQETYFQRTKVEHPARNRRIEYYEAEEVRVVCIARWNNNDLLEIRIDTERLESVRARQDRLAQVWTLLSGALDANDFLPWDLCSARRHVSVMRASLTDVEIGELRLVDSERGIASFRPETEHESVDDLDARTRAIDAFVTNDDSEVPVLNLHWKIPDKSRKDNPLQVSTVCGGRNTNELVIRARTQAGAIDYVTNRLRQFDNGTT